MTVSSVDFCLGANVRTHPLNIRDLKILSGLALALAMLPASSHAYTQEDQQRLCTGDVFRLCSSEIPNRARIIACMPRPSLVKSTLALYPVKMPASSSRRTRSATAGGLNETCRPSSAKVSRASS